MSMNRLMFGLSLVLFALSGRTAAAASKDAKERLAKKACLSGDPEKGVAILSELYVDTDEPVFVFNQGRCYEQNRRYQDAIGRFQEYLRVAKNARKGDKAAAKEHIADCQKLIAEDANASRTKAAEPAGEPTTAREVRKLGTDLRERTAKRACLTGTPSEGVAILTDLYLDTNDPNYIFNQGRCFEQNRQYEDAIGRFREYLIKATNLNEQARNDTEKHIANCQSYLSGKQTTTTSTGTTATQPSAVQSSTVEVRVSAQPTDVTGSLPRLPATRPGGGLRAAGWIGITVGGAGLISGLVLNLKANSLKTDLENDYNPDVASSRQSYKTMAWLAYGVGGACLAGGVVLSYLGWRRGRTADLALAPSIGPDMAGAALLGAF
jgi:tetratricopeptide (TPR) repeat protein